MSALHPDLADGRWQTFSLIEQLANVGSEIERALKWRAKGKQARALSAFERGLDLLGLTISDPRHRCRLKELTRLREVLLDSFVGENDYGSTDEAWHRYFHPFGVAASASRI